MTKPHHVRRALLIALTVVAALVAGYMVYLTSCAAAEQTVTAILPTLLLAGATQDQVKYGCEYGQHLGMAFQMVDDLLDVIGTEEALGKSIGKDVAEEKLTWIAIRGIEGTREDAARETALAVDAAAKIGGDMKFLQTLAQSTLNRVQ